MKIKLNDIREYLRDYRFNSILVHSFLMCFAAMVAAFSVILIVVLNDLGEVTDRQTGIRSVQELDKTRQRLDNVISEAKQMSAQLSLDDEIWKFLIPDAGEIFGQDNVIRVKERIDDYFHVSEYMDSIYVYSYRNDIVVTDSSAMPLEKLEDDNWYENLTQRLFEPARVICRLKEDRYPYVLSYIQPVFLDQTRLLGCVIINLDQTRLRELVSTDFSDSTEVFLIVDSKGKVIFSTDELLMQRSVRYIEGFDEVNLETPGYQILGRELYAVGDSDYYDWKYVSRESLDKYHSEERKELVRYYIFLILSSILISLAVSFIIAYNNYRPVISLLTLMRDPKLRNTQLMGDLGLKKNEMQEIALNIVRNLYANGQIREEIDQYVNLAEKAQVSALQAQITPHFLNNTLENIRWKSYEMLDGDNDISKIVVNLSKMLRLSLDNENPIVPFSEEIDNSQYYINIINIRFGEAVSVRWDIDERTLNLPIIKVCLQPLIENSLQHGLRAKRSGGEIVISSRRKDTSYEIRVRDNGVGMSGEELEAIRSSLNKDFRLLEKHIGVCNVSQRLKLLLNRDAVLQIESEPEKGTVVWINIPIEEDRL